MESLNIAKALINRPSVTPNDQGCQDYISEILKELGFSIENLRFGDVDNLWAIHGTEKPIFCFLGHTDVVPSGPENEWKHPPFIATEENGMLYGRGAADMKGCIASFLCAVKSFMTKHPDHKGSLAVLLTSDEEGLGVNGVSAVIKDFEKRGLKIDYCLVGEPSSEEELADVVKVGRRGSLHGHLLINGIQGHVAYPQLARNPIHQAMPALQELCSREWDRGNEFFPATSFQISNYNSGTGADNVIPGKVELLFNFRYSTELNEDLLKKAVHEVLDRHQLDYSLKWRLSGLPFLTGKGKLVNAVVQAIETSKAKTPLLSTAGGTSDGRFVAPTGAEVVELGLINRTIHKVNEHISIEHLDELAIIYEKVIEGLLLQQ
ncbi:MAG: succinyl-diaminopimelate desuccinylase [Candidatus Obscuribacterales bacterium]|nr:succinyl-diaminopimelate desuccinylase [Candidatus Obscuribacterales bacterium]